MAIANMQVQFEDLFWLFTYLAVLVGVIVFGLMIYFIVKYREKSTSSEPDDAPILGRLPAPRGHARTVILTVSLSTIILGVLAVAQGANQPVIYNCSVLVTGHRFYWDFNYAGYPNRTITGAPFCHDANCLFAVPQGYDIRLNVTSADVFHNFGIIAIKVKADAYPGHINNIWFNAETPGNYTIQCYELCG
ncbi:hypothetical protein E6H26_06225, partial [Candidatus Bathyarchaeota archaeon]